MGSICKKKLKMPKRNRCLNWRQSLKRNNLSSVRQILYIPIRSLWNCNCDIFNQEIKYNQNMRQSLDTIHRLRNFRNPDKMHNLIQKKFLKEFGLLNKEVDLEMFCEYFCHNYSFEDTVEFINHNIVNVLDLPVYIVSFDHEEMIEITTTIFLTPEDVEWGDLIPCVFLHVGGLGVRQNEDDWWWVQKYGKNENECLCCGIKFSSYVKLVEHVASVDTINGEIIEKNELCHRCKVPIDYTHVVDQHPDWWSQRVEIYKRMEKNKERKIHDNWQKIAMQLNPNDKEEDLKHSDYEGLKFAYTREKLKQKGDNSDVIHLITAVDLEATGLKDPKLFSETMKNAYLGKRSEELETGDYTLYSLAVEEINEDYFNPALDKDNGFAITTCALSVAPFEKYPTWQLNHYLSEEHIKLYNEVFFNLFQTLFKNLGFVCFNNKEKDIFLKDLLIDGVYNWHVYNAWRQEELYQLAHDNSVCNTLCILLCKVFDSPFHWKDNCRHCLILYVGAHNGGGFDFFFILRSLFFYKQSYKPKLRIFPRLFNNRIQSIEVTGLKCVNSYRLDKKCQCAIRFIDSIQYCPGALAKIAKLFNLGVLPDLGKFDFHHEDYHYMYLHGRNPENPYRWLTLEDNDFNTFYKSWVKLYRDPLEKTLLQDAFKTHPIEEDRQCMTIFYNRNDAYLVIKILLVMGDRFQLVFNKIKHKLAIKNENHTLVDIHCFNFMWKNTLASLSYQFLCLMQDGLPIYIPKGEAGIVIGSTMIGGRSECFVQGSVFYDEGINFGQDGVTQMDISGMYGNCQLSNFFPAGPPEMSTTDTLNEINKIFMDWEEKTLDQRYEHLVPHVFPTGIHFGCYKVSWPKNGLKGLTFFGLIGTQIEIIYLNNDKTQRVANICWNNLQKIQWMDLNTAIMHARAGWQVRAIEQNNMCGYHFPQGCKAQMREYIDLCFEIKQEGVDTKNPVTKQIGKDLANSCYGKVSMKPINTTVEFVNETEQKKLLNQAYNHEITILSTEPLPNNPSVTLMKYKKNTPEYFTPVQYGSTILALSRQMFLQFCWADEELERHFIQPHRRKLPFYYVDTDSKYVTNRHLALVQPPETFVTSYRKYKKPPAVSDDPPRIFVDFEIKDPNGKAQHAVYLGKKCNITLDEDFNLTSKTAKGSNLQEITPEKFWAALATKQAPQLFERPYTARVGFKKQVKVLDVSTTTLVRYLNSNPLIYEDSAFIYPNRKKSDPLSVSHKLKEKTQLTDEQIDVIISPAKLYTALTQFEHLSRSENQIPVTINVLNAIPTDYLEDKVYKCLCDCEPRIEVTLCFHKGELPPYIKQQPIPSSVLTCIRKLNLCRDHNCRAVIRPM